MNFREIFRKHSLGIKSNRLHSWGNQDPDPGIISLRTPVTYRSRRLIAIR